MAALLALFFGTLGTPHSSDPRHDSDRALVVIPALHDEADHQLQAGRTSPASPESHCEMCHFARSFRPRADARGVSAPSARAGTPHDLETFTAIPSALTAQPPLRSPPTSPLPA